MKIDRTRVKNQFAAYTANYDAENPKIKLKIEHTYHVAENAEQIVETVFRDEQNEIDLAWLLGMLHDIGRFEQLKRYDTFIDALSVDHAELGADLLFREGLLTEFVDGGAVGDSEIALCETAIRQHNKLRLPEDLDERTKIHCQILRDADKTDIFRVIAEVPYEKRVSERENAPDRKDARPEIMECVKNHTCVPRISHRTEFEALISQCCMAFELVYPETRKMVRAQGNLRRLVSEGTWTREEEAQLAVLRHELRELLI